MTVPNTPKTVIHYMGWYSDTHEGVDSMRHWKHGTANRPLLGHYNSHNKSVILCHMMWSWAAGIDAVVVNVKDEYDRQTLLKVQEVIAELRLISGGLFDLQSAISFDDQGFDLEPPLDTALRKITQFKMVNYKNNDAYLTYEGKPVIFSFDYPHKFLTAETLRASLDQVFGDRGALLVWNTFGEGENTQDYVDAFYPWVQPGGPWEASGLNWGADYLDYFYQEVDRFDISTHRFVGGGVWPGFDDRNNVSWGGNRLIARQGGGVYDSTWQYISNYSGTLPMAYVMVETWNDWNEGTEVEPSVEHGYQYILQTEKNILRLVGKGFVPDTSKYELAKKLSEVSQTLSNPKDSLTMVHLLNQYFKEEFEVVRDQLEQ
ncbi:glycoside hydrolase family 71/99 protein [Marinoscillum furvescens]|nr:hypothetical protein [Marinoscillum furvescens]